ncbi:hypothetical protein E1176_17850 [Fulvivirga sp. RKSG066]|uniref:DUF6992 family protein n=1 Tax=Fulvivirga aurantia TaxID=2529383 RepID=UPI0012BC0102|nr:hypothetical protein [Fulvivirga aurantia]MTI22901.1 hypothetical protein [Fulvivirga aurantia]
MKCTLALLILLCASVCCKAQSLEEINQQRIKKTQTGMLILGSWATVNIISSPILKQNASGSDKYFYDMNLYWNTVNLAIATVGYLSARKELNKQYSLQKTIEKQNQLQRILLLNTGLDLAYVTTGLFLKTKGQKDESNRLEGFGESLILQGAFLFLFDLGSYLMHNQESKKINAILERIQLSAHGIGLRYTF